MNIQRHSWCALLSLSLLVTPGLASAKFFGKMTSLELAQEIHLWIKSGMSIDVIAKAACKSGLSPEEIAYSLIKSGQRAEAVVGSLISIDPKSASSITAAAIKAAPHQSNAIYATALTSAELDAAITLRTNEVQNDALVEGI